MMRPNASVEKVYLYPKPVDFRKSIDGLAALVELDINVAVFDPVLFVPDRKVVLFDYTSSRAQEVPLCLLESYRGYVMSDAPWRYNRAWSDWRAWPMRDASSWKRRKCSPRARPIEPISP